MTSSLADIRGRLAAYLLHPDGTDANADMTAMCYGDITDCLLLIGELANAARAALGDRMYRDWPEIANLLITAIEKTTGEKLR